MSLRGVSRDDGPRSDPDQELSLDELASREGLDDELLRQCGQLLTHAEVAPPRRPPGPRASRVRDHLLVAKLAFDVDLLDRAYAEVGAALEVLPLDEEALRLLASIHHRRGRLSEAIAIWTQLASGRTDEGSALRQLAQVLELSLHDASDRDRYVPERLAAVLNESLVDLEQSFRFAFANNLPGALSAVERVAHRARGKDVHLLKVSTIQRAWLLEQAQDVTRAIASLESLADVAGLTNDVERLLCLSILYEREGTPERIRRAVRAVSYAYLSTREPTLLRRLARLLGRLGHKRVADRFEARYLELFRRQAHALRPRELARALTLRFVPVDRLADLAMNRRFAAALLERHRGRLRSEHRRRAAVLALVLCDLTLAHGLFETLDRDGTASAVDNLYLAEVEESVLGGPAAPSRRVAALRGAVMDAATLLPVLAAIEPATNLSDHLSPGELALAERAIAAHTRAHPASAAGWRALARVASASGRVAEAKTHQAHAAALEQPKGGHGPRVLAAAAVRRGGEVHGLMHELWIEERTSRNGGFAAVTFEPDDVLGSVTPELRAYAVNVFYTVLAFARAHYPHRLEGEQGRRWVLKFTKEDEPSSGDSAGLPMAVAFLAALLRLSPPPDVALSGAIVCDAHDVVMLRAVGDVEAKVAGAFERRLRRIVLPADNREDVERAERIPREIARSVVRYAKTFEEVCAQLFVDLR